MAGQAGRAARAPSCNEVPDWLGRWRARAPGVFERYLELDPRSLGLARVHLGVVLILEAVRRIPYLGLFFTDEGLLPRAAVWQDTREPLVSLFFLAPHAFEASLVLGACAVVFALFALGAHTRIVHPLAFVAILGMHARTPLFEDGSENTVRLLTFWTMFLPLGARFSIDARRRGGVEVRPAVSVAVLAVLLQLATIYALNVVHKNGAGWRDGSAVHYVLHQDRIVTWLGLQLRPHMTPALSGVLTWGTLAVEAALPLLLLSPVRTAAARRLAVVLGIGLHTGFLLTMNLGMISAAMIGFFLLLVPTRDWDAIARLPWVRGALGPPNGEPKSAREDAEARPGRAATHWGPSARELIVLLFGIALGLRVLRDNGLPRAVRIGKLPAVLSALGDYPRLFQTWSMFAPDAPLVDSHVFVDAVTADGRHVDPLNEVGSRVATTPLRAIPVRLGLDELFCDYGFGIATHTAFHEPLREWIFRYDERTGDPRDRIESFTVWTIEDTSPPPGEKEPTEVRRRLVLQAERE